jgi:tetratricopeptide (TPR) repeat protein
MTHSKLQPGSLLPPSGEAGSTKLAWIRILLAVVTIAAFARLCTADFSNWDDPRTTYDNPRLDPPSAEHIAWFWTHPYMDIYAPVPFTVWGILRSVGKLPSADEMGIDINASLFHTANLLLHLVSVLAAFELLRRLTGHAAASAIGALLFALHPVQVESVGWVSGMKDVLYGMFALIALWQYVMYLQKTKDRRQETEEGGSGPASHYIAALIALLLALFSKPTAVVTPLLALVIDYWFLRQNLKKAIASLWPWFVLAIPFAVVAKVVQPPAEVYAWSVWSRPLIAADALAFYLYKLVYPAHLAPDYGRNPPVLLHSTWRYWTWAVPVGVALLICALRKRVKWLLPAALLFLICILPISGLTPFDFQYYSTVTDHYLYLAMIGPALAAAMLLKRWWGAAPAIIAAIVLGVLGVRTSAQTAYWQNSVALFEHTLKINPQSGVARERLGAFYDKRGLEYSKKVDESNRQAIALARAGDARQAAMKAAEAEAYKELALNDWRNAEKQYTLALKENPRWPVLRLNLSGALANQRKYDQAMEQLQAIIDMQSSLPPSLRGGYETRWFNLGMEAYKRGDDKKAAEDFQLALREVPGDAVSSRALQIVKHKIQEAASRPPTTQK